MESRTKSFALIALGAAGYLSGLYEITTKDYSHNNEKPESVKQLEILEKKVASEERAMERFYFANRASLSNPNENLVREVGTREIASALKRQELENYRTGNQQEIGKYENRFYRNAAEPVLVGLIGAVLLGTGVVRLMREDNGGSGDQSILIHV